MHLPFRRRVVPGHARVGRGERIRTSDILLPKQALYQAEPRPEPRDGAGFSRFANVVQLAKMPTQHAVSGRDWSQSRHTASLFALTGASLIRQQPSLPMTGAPPR